MSVARPLALLALALLVSVPATQAYAQPVFYFLKDVPGGPQDQIPDPPPEVPPLPLATPTLDINPGVLDPYTPENPNSPNATTARERYVVVGQDLVLPVQFITPADHTHPNRLKGPLFVGLWVGQSSTYLANLTVTLYEVPAEGAAIALANASLNLDFNQSNVPDPQMFVPENTTDPETIVYYEAAVAMGMLFVPPALFQLGPVDITVQNGSAFAIGFALSQGNSPVPLPAGAFTTIQYDGAYKPSFVYAPWYAPDPPRATTSPRPSSSYTSSYTPGGGRTLTGTSSPGDDDKDSPGFALPVSLLALLAVAAIAARRRTK